MEDGRWGRGCRGDACVARLDLPRHTVHHLPLIHARYQVEEAAIAIEDGSVFDGGLGPGGQWRNSLSNRSVTVM